MQPVPYNVAANALIVVHRALLLVDREVVRILLFPCTPVSLDLHFTIHVTMNYTILLRTGKMRSANQVPTDALVMRQIWNIQIV